MPRWPLAALLHRDDRAGHAHSAQSFATSLVIEGVFERLPNFRLVMLEAGRIGSIYFAGYALAVPIPIPIPTRVADLTDGRWLLTSSSLLDASASLAFGLKEGAATAGGSGPFGSALPSGPPRSTFPSIQT